MMRLGVPNLSRAIEGYAQGDLSWVCDFPDRFESLGGKFCNFIFCNGTHKICFDFDFLKELLKQAGFCDIRMTAARESMLYQKVDLAEYSPYGEYLYVECLKK